MIFDQLVPYKWSKLTSTFRTFDPNFSYDSLLWNLLSENVKNPHIENQIELFNIRLHQGSPLKRKSKVGASESDGEGFVNRNSLLSVLHNFFVRYFLQILKKN